VLVNHSHPAQDCSTPGVVALPFGGAGPADVAWKASEHQQRVPEFLGRGAARARRLSSQLDHGDDVVATLHGAQQLKRHAFGQAVAEETFAFGDADRKPALT